MSLNMFIDAIYKENWATKIYHMGFTIFIGRSPIIWYSKIQNRLDPEGLGVEFTDLKYATESNLDLRYNLRVLGVEVFM